MGLEPPKVTTWNQRKMKPTAEDRAGDGGKVPKILYTWIQLDLNAKDDKSSPLLTSAWVRDALLLPTE